MEWKKLHSFVEAINTYYAFAVLLYVAVLYIASHSHLFWWVLFGLTPIIAAWGGYLSRSYLDTRNFKHGFRVLSNIMSYEMGEDRTYKLSFSTKIKAGSNRMMVYPVGYQWSGDKDGDVPKVLSPGQHLIGAINLYDENTNTAKVGSYKEAVPSEGDWRYWFIGFDKTVYKGDIVDIRYTQKFHDKRKLAKPCMYYMVNTTTDRLELNVKFPATFTPKK